MRTMRTTARRCDGAREYASLRLDGELSDFESALLDSHIERCPTCRAFAEDLVGVTERLRNAPLERPLIVLTLPQRRFAALRTMQASAAAAAVVSVVAIGALFGMLHSNASAPGRVARLGSVAQEKREFRDLRRAVLTAPHPERQPGGLGNLSV